MEKETKYCITAIIIAGIWLLGQPMGGNLSISANLEKIPYFNLINSTISGSAEISGHMPIGIMVFMLFVNVITFVSDIEVLMMYFIILALIFMAYISYYIYKNWRK